MYLQPELLIGIHFAASGLQSTLTRFSARNRSQPETILFLSSATTLVITTAIALVQICAQPSLMAWASCPKTPQETSCWDFYLFNVLPYSLLMFIGVGYYIVSWLRYRSHGLLPSFVYEPLARLHVLIVVPFSMYFLEEAPSFWELLAAFLAIVAILIFSFNQPKGAASQHRQTQGIILLLIASLFAAALQLSAKLFMDPNFLITVSVLGYVIASNTATVIIAALLHLSKKKRMFTRQTLLFGIGTGTCNILALGSLLVFLIDGKASRIYSIAAMSMLVPVAIELAFKKERKPSGAEFFALVFAMGAMVVQSRN